MWDVRFSAVKVRGFLPPAASRTDIGTLEILDLVEPTDIGTLEILDLVEPTDIGTLAKLKWQGSRTLPLATRKAQLVGVLRLA